MTTIWYREALKEYSATFFIGFETEVILIKSLSPLKAVNDYGWSENPSLSAGTVEAVVTEEIANSLMKAGIDLQMYHSESSPGQVNIKYILMYSHSTWRYSSNLSLGLYLLWKQWMHLLQLARLYTTSLQNMVLKRHWLLESTMTIVRHNVIISIF